MPYDPIAIEHTDCGETDELRWAVLITFLLWPSLVGPTAELRVVKERGYQSAHTVQSGQIMADFCKFQPRRIWVGISTKDRLIARRRVLHLGGLPWPGLDLATPVDVSVGPTSGFATIHIAASAER